MSRDTEVFTVAAAGRDKGKVFIITEMGARGGHRWATRALFAMGAAGAELPDNIHESGMAGIATMGFNAFLQGIPFDLAEPLLEELLSCVKINHSPEKPELARGLMVDTDIEEIQTIFSLQKAVFMLHVRPFMLGDSQTTASPAVPASN